jgi:hypothetical protein
MAFDFSSYIPQSPTQATPAATTPTSSVGQYTPGFSEGPSANLDPALASQLFGYIGKTDSDANLLGADTKQKLIDAGLLKSITQGGAEGGDAQTTYELGDNAPTNFEGHTTRIDNTPEYQRVIGADSGAAKDQGLINPNAVKDDPLWGKVTYAGNKNQHDSMDTFWKVAPFIPSLFAMGAPLLFGGLAAAGGATAGGMIGSQTLSDIGGGTIAQGGAATASDLFAGAPAWLQKALPDLAKSGIKGLASGDGKFDFSKYIPTGLQAIAKGL